MLPVVVQVGISRMRQNILQQCSIVQTCLLHPASQHVFVFIMVLGALCIVMSIAHAVACKNHTIYTDLQFMQQKMYWSNRLWMFKSSNMNVLVVVTSNFELATVTSWISNFRTFIAYWKGYECSKLQNFCVLFCHFRRALIEEWILLFKKKVILKPKNVCHLHHCLRQTCHKLESKIN